MSADQGEASWPQASNRLGSRFDLIVFDWDGTLFDSTALIVQCIQAAVQDVGGQVPSRERAAWVIGLGLEQALVQAAPDVPAHRHAQLVQRYQYHWFARQHEVTLFDGVLPMLHDLRARGHRLAVATGKSRRGLDAALRSVALHGVFDATRTAEETASKPHPQMLLELMKELEVPPERTLMIGDTSHDLQLARNAGCAALAVGYGAHGHDELLAHAPLALVHSVAELHAWLQSHA
ncbi:5'-nucleotidase [Tepidimonas alkaliphilus]|uniref:5'-nucleotidase n=1 Tax=Tepidimonas alkaliphilus TaxID=2588942 RepID=A0A554W468_9BURK|nr:HAD-IIIA family hydrolase [Tepidimonas alkaliphilus]TSE18377.1 5'-nucleotidase [Tepidimonas alkaliphilus]